MQFNIDNNNIIFDTFNDIINNKNVSEIVIRIEENEKLEKE